MGLFATVWAILVAYYSIIWPLLIVLALAAAIKYWWNEVKYFFMKLRTGFPLVGFIARNARQLQESAPDTEGGLPWYDSERELCTRYHRFYEDIDKDPDFFDKCTNYLNKVEETGRKKPGPLLWGLSALLVVLEAYIFSLVLTPFISTNISADQAEWSALLLSVVIGIILLWLTHSMGKEIHKNSLVKKARVWYGHAKLATKANTLQTRKVPLEKTEQDEEDPPYLHIVHRVSSKNADFKPTWPVTIATILFIAAFAVGAYLIRAATLNEMETELVNASPYALSSAQPGDDSPFSTAITMVRPFTLPGAAEQDNQEADERAASEVISERIFAYKLTFIMLSVIFVGVQAIGIMIGSRYSFAGIDSEEAVRYRAGFSNRNEFVAWYERKRNQIVRDAEMHLSRLQKAIAQRHGLDGDNGGPKQRRSFVQYLREQERSKLSQQVQVQAVQDSGPSVSTQTPQTPDEPETETSGGGQTTQGTGNGDATEESKIKALGDLTEYSAEVLTSIAEEMELDPAKLLNRKKAQEVVKRVRQGG